LTEVNEAGGFTYFNKERFEELLGWLQVPALMEIAQEKTGATGALREVERGVESACEMAREAGYQLQRYLKAGRVEIRGAVGEAGPSAKPQDDDFKISDGIKVSGGVG
jgi:hypothetical protein